MRRALNQLPPDLDGAFENVLDRIQSKGKESRELALATLAWVLYSARPLSLAELLEALSVEIWSPKRDLENVPDLDRMLECCAGLVIIETGTETVHFAHYSVQEYLVKRVESICIPTGLYLARACLTYLNFEDFDRGPVESSDSNAYQQRLTEFPFLSYSACNWTLHMKGTGEDDGEIIRQMENLFSSVPRRDTMLQARYETREHVSSSQSVIHLHPYSSTLLHIVSGAGLASVVKNFFHKNRQIVDLSVLERDSGGRTPLHDACKEGHEDIVRQFLQLDCNRFVTFIDEEGATPLHLAAERGHTKVIEILLWEGNADTASEDIYGCNPLHRAIASSELEATHLIMRKSWETLSGGLEKRYTYGYTLLHQAAMLGYEKGVEWLLKAGASPDVVDVWGNSPLTIAALRGHAGIVKILLEATTGDLIARKGTPLHLSAMHGRTEVVDILLKTGRGDTHARDKLGFTPLHWAAAGGQVAVVEKLLPVTHLPLPAEIRSVSPYQLAAWGGYQDVQRQILHHYSMAINVSLKHNPIHETLLSSFIFGVKDEGEDVFERTLAPDQLSYLFKYWASIRLERKQFQAAAAWLDLDIICWMTREATKGRFQLNMMDPMNIRHGLVCDHCSAKPIWGYRYRCKSCILPPWYDLCAPCFEKRSGVCHPHDSFLKIPSEFPMPGLKDQLKKLRRVLDDESRGSGLGRIQVGG